MRPYAPPAVLDALRDLADRDPARLALALEEALLDPAEDLLQLVPELRFDPTAVTEVVDQERLRLMDPPRPGDEDGVGSVFDVLGHYDARKRRIALHEPLLRERAEDHGAPYEWLKEVVRLHEWAHALFHLGRLDTGRPDDASPFEEGLEEQLAQLFTRAALAARLERASTAEARAILQGQIDLFDRMAGRQPPRYNIDMTRHAPWERVRGTVVMAKGGKLRVDLDAWRVMARW